MRTDCIHIFLTVCDYLVYYGYEWGKWRTLLVENGFLDFSDVAEKMVTDLIPGQGNIEDVTG